jgi:23S rRNA (guanosine2251-2'-O)-methyltransferase
MKPELVLVIHNVRSAHNVGSLLRTADGAGVAEVYLSGYSPVPARLAKEAVYYTKSEKEIAKTALGAERSLPWKRLSRIDVLQRLLKKQGCFSIALEQARGSADLADLAVTLKAATNPRVALIVGNEVRGIDARILRKCDAVLELPMKGDKNSLNVSVAGGIALYGVSDILEVEPAGYQPNLFS